MAMSLHNASSFTYYQKLNEDSKAEAEAGLTANINDAVKYYAEQSKGREAIGVYFVPKGATPIFSNVVHGERAKTFDIMKNGDAIDPKTGDQYRKEVPGKNSMKGCDVTLSPPKPFSVAVSQAEHLAINGKTQQERDYGRRVSDDLQGILREANDRTMQSIYDQGFFESRISEDGVKTRAAAKDLSAVQWMHFSSREGDPQIHFHNVWYNVGRKPDGSIGSIDNYLLTKNRHFINAVFNAQAMSLMEEKFGWSFTKDKHNYSIDGSIKELDKGFSKRTEKVLQILKDEYGKDGREDASAALLEKIVLTSRNSKAELPPLEQLIMRWG